MLGKERTIKVTEGKEVKKEWRGGGWENTATAAKKNGGRR